MDEDSDHAVWLAIKGMLPKTRLGRKQIKNVKIFKGADHDHAAQKPVALVLKGGKR